jgi:hypothetical protein
VLHEYAYGPIESQSNALEELFAPSDDNIIYCDPDDNGWPDDPPIEDLDCSVMCSASCQDDTGASIGGLDDSIDSPGLYTSESPVRKRRKLSDEPLENMTERSSIDLATSDHGGRSPSRMRILNKSLVEYISYVDCIPRPLLGDDGEVTDFRNQSPATALDGSMEQLDDLMEQDVDACSATEGSSPGHSEVAEQSKFIPVICILCRLHFKLY